MSICIPTYMLASGLIAGGMNWWQSIGTILLGNLIVLIPTLLNAHVGAKSLHQWRDLTFEGPPFWLKKRRDKEGMAAQLNRRLPGTSRITSVFSTIEQASGGINGMADFVPVQNIARIFDDAMLESSACSEKENVIDSCPLNLETAVASRNRHPVCPSREIRDGGVQFLSKSSVSRTSSLNCSPVPDFAALRTLVPRRVPRLNLESKERSPFR